MPPPRGPRPPRRPAKGVLRVAAVGRDGQPAEDYAAGGVDIAAPGIDVAGLRPGASSPHAVSGTSYAVAAVAGTAALARAAHPQLDPAQLVDILTATADTSAATASDTATGWGMIDPRAAIDAQLPEQRQRDRAPADSRWLVRHRGVDRDRPAGGDSFRMGPPPVEPGIGDLGYHPTRSRTRTKRRPSMRSTSLRRAVVAAATVGVLLTVAPFFSAPALADTVDQLPELPRPQDGCVADSGKVLTAPPWAQLRLAQTQVWPLTRGEGVVIAVLDTGVSAAAPALAGAVRPGTDVVAGGAADSDCVGRGTALAGMVAARPVPSSPFVGVAPAATIVPIRIVDARGGIPPDGITRGITAALAAGADVILVGTGTTVSTPAMARAVRAAEAQDVVVVASAANDDGGRAGGAVSYPAAYPEVLAVGGIDEQGRPVGKPGDGSGVDVAGPGGGAASVSPRGTGHYRVGGTPVAAAYVAGAVGLVRSYSPGLTAQEVRERLVATAETPTAADLRRWLGAGMVDVLEAVAATRVGDSSTRRNPMGDVVLPQAPDRPGSYRVAILASIVVLLGTAVVVLAGLTVRSGRRREWRE